MGNDRQTEASLAPAGDPVRVGDFGRDDTTQRLLPAANGLPIHSGFDAMNEPRIIVAEAHSHWNAWFEDRPFDNRKAKRVAAMLEGRLQMDRRRRGEI
jgi:hypothetical protein